MDLVPVTGMDLVPVTGVSPQYTRTGVSPQYTRTGVSPQMCTFGRHFAVLTINEGQGHIRDQLFLVREGCQIWKSQEFKVVTLRPGFETGSMTGLISTFR